MEKIKIGLFVDSFYPMIDGVVAVVDNYARGLMKYADVTVFTLNGRESYDDSVFPYKVVRCKSLKVGFLDYNLGTPKFDKKFKEELDNSNLDIVHIHSPFALGEIGVKYAKKHNIPLIFTFHSQFKEDFYKATKSKFMANILLKSIMRTINKADICFTMNEYSKNLLIDYGCTRPIDIISNAVDFLPETVSTKEFEEKYQIEKDELMLMYLGRINTLKNLDFILNSLTKLPEDVKYKMVFVGGGAELNQFKNKAIKLNLQDKVIFTDKILDRNVQKPILQRADLFLFPSKYDTDGIVKTEASCFHTPTLALKNTGAGSAITHNVNGILIDEDEQQFVDAIVKCNNDREYLKELGENAFRDLYVNWDTKIDQIYNKYIEIIKNKKGL